MDLLGAGRCPNGLVSKFCFRWASGEPVTTILDPKQAPGQCPLARLNLQCVAKSDIGLLETQDIALLETQDIALVETQDIALLKIQDIALVGTQDSALLETEVIVLLGSESDSGEAQECFSPKQNIIGEYFVWQWVKLQATKQSILQYLLVWWMFIQQILAI